jgi:hypothetical protein
MKHILNNLSEEEKNAIREQHAGGMKVITENFSKLIGSKLGDSKPLVREQSINPQTKPTINKTVNPKIDLDCNKKLIVKSQLPKLSADANFAIINYFCQGNSAQPTSQPGPGARPTSQPGPNLSRPTSQPRQVRPSTTRPPAPQPAQRPNYPIGGVAR